MIGGKTRRNLGVNYDLLAFMGDLEFANGNCYKVLVLWRVNLACQVFSII